MRIAAKTEYACIAVLELAVHWTDGEPIRANDIAETNGIPSRFLVQILLQLKNAGLVTSTRGALGGYQLALPPGEITLGNVIAAMEGADEPPATNLRRANRASAAVMAAWREAYEAQQTALDSVTFAELLERSRAEAEPMYYI